MTEVTNETIEKTLQDFIKFRDKKIEKKGKAPFNSELEIYAKICEEQYELLQELHKKNFRGGCTRFREELTDLMMVAYFGLCSLNQKDKK